MQNYVKTSQYFKDKRFFFIQVQEKLKVCTNSKQSFSSNYFNANDSYIKVYAHIQ